MLHKFFIGLAVVLVITGVFIQETMKVAATDNNIMLPQGPSYHIQYAAYIIYNRCNYIYIYVYGDLHGLHFVYVVKRISY